jgi:hypothetical protein
MVAKIPADELNRLGAIHVLLVGGRERSRSATDRLLRQSGR